MLSLDVFVSELTKSISLFKPEATLVIAFLLAITVDLIFRKSRICSTAATGTPPGNVSPNPRGKSKPRARIFC